MKLHSDRCIARKRALKLSPLQQNRERRTDMSSGNRLKARRCLFGAPDEEQADQMATAMQEEMKNQAEEMKQKYNFDFENETPLEGRYQWEKAEQESEKKKERVTETPAGGKSQDEKNDALVTPKKTLPSRQSKDSAWRGWKQNSCETS